jgi:DNA-directed RNA polymerase subunit omega
MLVKPAVTDLLEKIDDRFELITITSKRARQIAQGAPVLTDHKEDKSPVTLAVWEVYEDKVKEDDGENEIVQEIEVKTRSKD